MSVDLALAKQHLRVLHDDEDVLIGTLIDASLAHLQKLLGDDYEPYLDDLAAAQLLLIEWLYRPEDKVDLDEIFNLPRAVVALATPYRLPTIQ